MSSRRRRDQALNEELEAYVELLVFENIRTGMSPAEARRAALLALGGTTQVKENVRDVRAGAWIETLLSDVRFAIRTLARTPSFTVVVVLTLALGIGATTAIFSAIEAVLLRPFSGGDVSRQAQIFDTWRGDPENVSAGDFFSWKATSRSFAHMGAAAYSNVTIADARSADRILAGQVTAGFFPSVGARAALGRTLAEDEDQEGRNHVVVLSDALWHTRFGGDRAALGRTLQINGVPYEVVGIMPPGFDPLLAGERVWIPLVLSPQARADRDSHFLNVVGVLRDGTTFDRASAEFDAIALALRQQFPVLNKDVGARVTPLREANVGPVERRMYVMLGAVLLVLLIACANVSNMLLARGNARGKEIAVRAALGAGRGRIVRQLLTESLLIGLAAGASGILVAIVGIKVLVTSAPPNLPRLDGATLDVRVLAFAFGVSILSSLVFGLLPALRASRFDLQGALRDGSRAAAAAMRDRARAMLVGAEVALALTLLMGAGLLIRSAINLQRVDPGFRIENVLTARAALPPGDPSDSLAAFRGYERTFAQLAADLRRRPGFAEVSLASQAPLGFGGTTNGLLPEGKAPNSRDFIQSRLHIVTPDYFSTLSIPIKQGRSFSAQDDHGTPRVMVISETVARRAFPGENPLGKRLTCCEQTPSGIAAWTVIGVAGDVHGAGPGAAIEPEFYLVLSQTPPAAWGWMNRTMTIIARPSSGDASALAPTIRAAAADIGRSVPIFGISTMEHSLGINLADSRFNTILLAGLGGLGLLLSAVGIYGVIGYFVMLRTREIGIRIALGATRSQITRLMTFSGMRPVIIGAAVGCVGALALTRLLADSLFNVAPRDPVTLALVVVALLLVGLSATILPARRAARVDPVRAIAE